MLAGCVPHSCSSTADAHGIPALLAALHAMSRCRSSFAALAHSSVQPPSARNRSVTVSQSKLSGSRESALTHCTNVSTSVPVKGTGGEPGGTHSCLNSWLPFTGLSAHPACRNTFSGPDRQLLLDCLAAARKAILALQRLQRSCG